MGDRSFREAGLCAFDCINGNCALAAQSYLERTGADACLFQEMRVRTANCPQKERSATRDGWSLTIGPAINTVAGSTSAGVAIAVRAHFGIARSPYTPPCDIDTSRIIVRWVGTLCRGGVHLISVYLFFGEGLSCRNIDLLQAIAGVICELRGPWILAGDFNITPQDLISTGWLQLVGGTVHAPSLPTCNGRVIDFFVTSATLAFAVVAATVVSDTGTYPHSAVRLLVRASPRCVMVNSLRKPAAFAAVLAAGCAPLGPDYSDVVTVHGVHSATTDNLNLGYTTWIARVENELADVCSLDGHERSLAVGRAMGPQFVWQPALGPVGSDSTRVRPVTAAWQVLAAWLGQLSVGSRPTGNSLMGASSFFRSSACFLVETWQPVARGTTSSAVFSPSVGFLIWSSEEVRISSSTPSSWGTPGFAA